MIQYAIAINFYSEPNFRGNCSRYYFAYKRGNKVGLTGIANSKRYLSLKPAEKMVEKLNAVYADAKIEIVEL